jgi:hypothetical protein
VICCARVRRLARIGKRIPHLGDTFRGRWMPLAHSSRSARAATTDISARVLKHLNTR